MTTTAGNTGTTSSTITSGVTSKGNKNPPLLQKARSYDDWVKKLNIWVKITCLPAESQGGAVLMTLEGEAENAVLELTDDKVTSADGVKNIIVKFTYTGD